MSSDAGDTIYQKSILSDVTHTATFATIHFHANYLSKSHPQADAALKKLVGSFPTLIKEINDSLEAAGHIQSGFNKAGLHGIISLSDSVAKNIVPNVDLSVLPSYPSLHGKEAYSAFPATGGEIFIHLKSDQKDPCFIVMRKFMQSLRKIKLDGTNEDLAVKWEEVDGFLHQFRIETQRGRDLTGFEDGTKNPKTTEAKIAATVIPEKGGSLVIAQKWVHDLDLWESKDVHSIQEKVFGRTKDKSERDKKMKEAAPLSHVTLTDLGKRGEILRHSMPYGNSTEHGLFFVGYSAEVGRFHDMLTGMLKASAEPELDMMKYIKCVTGQYFYAPSTQELKLMSQ